MQRPIESLIAYHCAPALAGIKPANLAACEKSKISNPAAEIERLSGELGPRGISMDILCECDRRALVLVYREDRLCRFLTRPEIRGFLVSLGYPRDFSLESYLAVLRKRLSGGDFPHEIGAFLGYPIHDILGFIAHKGGGWLLSGEWKVYADEDRARLLFHRYRACRRAVLGRVLAGRTLAELFTN